MSSSCLEISTCQSRGCIPVPVEVTASIVEIQQKDPYFRGFSPRSPFLQLVRLASKKALDWLVLYLKRKQFLLKTIKLPVSGKKSNAAYVKFLCV